MTITMIQSLEDQEKEEENDKVLDGPKDNVHFLI